MAATRTRDLRVMRSEGGGDLASGPALQSRSDAVGSGRLRSDWNHERTPAIDAASRSPNAGFAPCRSWHRRLLCTDCVHAHRMDPRVHAVDDDVQVAPLVDQVRHERPVSRATSAAIRRAARFATDDDDAAACARHRVSVAAPNDRRHLLRPSGRCFASRPRPGAQPRARGRRSSDPRRRTEEVALLRRQRLAHRGAGVPRIAKTLMDPVDAHRAARQGRSPGQ